MARRGINPVINALSTLMFIIMIALVIVINVRKNKFEKKKEAMLKMGMGESE